MRGEARVVGCRRKSLIASACILALLAWASCGGRQQDPKITMRARTGEAPEATRECTGAERAQIRVLIEVIKNYWALPYENEYSTFSSGFKQILNGAGVADAADYAQVMASNQREWLKQTYQTAELRDSTHCRVTALADWKETDYQGVQTVIFDMVKEDGTWKIASIFY